MENKKGLPPIMLSLVPIVLLILTIVYIMIVYGADNVLTYSSYVLLAMSIITLVLSRLFHPCSLILLKRGLCKSAKQILPAVPILILISTISATWMLGGVVPTIIVYGLELLSPTVFLVICTIVCSLISILTGSSWTTCATIGVAFMGIGNVMGYDPACTAGAVISGAYFGDKMSPLSDTTILASSTVGVNLFTHVKYMMITTVPSLILALIVFSIIGLITNVTNAAETSQTIMLLEKTFHISPWLLLAPVVTCTLIVLRVKVLLTLFISTLMGVCCLVFMQPSIFGLLTAESGAFWAIVNVLCTETSINTGSDMLNNLVSTSGISGMLETIKLVLCAMLFGGALIGTGMLSSITRKLSQKLNGLRKIVSTTVGTGLLVNACTGDQYLSLIVTGNIYKNLYSRNGLEPRLLSRSLEDSISVTSVLIPWNSCGMTQSTVLGVNTFYYLPYCVFNYMCPIISIIVASIGYKIYRRKNKAE